MKLTDKQKAAYLADPTKCPCCGHCDIFTFESHSRCRKCNATWTDSYKITVTDITLTRNPTDPEDEK